MSAACLVSVGGVVMGWLSIAWFSLPGKPITLESALETLDSGAYVEARELAERLQSQGTLAVEKLGGPAFVRGAAAAYEADDTWSNDRNRYYLLAARYLEEARDRGFPPGRRAEGLYLLGRSLYQSGQIPASRPILKAALKVNRAKRTEIHRLLAGAYLEDANPKLAEALAENRLYLSDRNLAAAAVHEGLLQRARILLRMKRITECIAALEKIPPAAKNHSEAIIVRGRLLIHEARSLKNKSVLTAEDRRLARQKYEAAAGVLRKAQGRDTLANQTSRKAMYLIGVCFLEMGNHRAALEQFSRTRKLHADTPEGLASAFQEAELSRQLGRDREALAGYRRTLRAVGSPANYSNPWISLDQLRARMLTTYQDYLKTEDFQLDVQLVRLFYPLFSRVRTLELAAEVYRSWGQALLARADNLPPDKAEPLRRKGRLQFRRAGRVYARLAELQITTRRFPDQLFNSADSYFQGQDYHGAVRMLKRYLKDQARRRHPEALVKLGEAQLALDRTDEALAAFRECVEFHPRDVAAYRARLLASLTYLEKGDSKQAETLLRENLNGEYLTPASNEWRDSLFALGELLHIEHRYGEAAIRLDEAIRRYPHHPRTIGARYLLADSYRQSAKAARKNPGQNVPGATGVVRGREIHELLDKALDEYRQLREVLGRRQETGELDSPGSATLRNCYFAIGGVLVDLGQYEPAIKAYSIATNRYQKHPEVLEAYVQIASAYRRLNKPVEARATLEQAKAALGRMKPETRFEETTNYSRQQWSELLDSLATL